VAWAFLAAHVCFLFGRAAFLGDPLAITLHSLQSGALLLFTFFMISDPRTTPDAREARIIFGVLAAAGAYYVQFRLFRTNGLLWSLFCLSPLVPLLDRLLPGDRYLWPAPAPGAPRKGDVDATLVADPGRLAAGGAVR
jgi:Na+-translocating ferredoxin:NAD+ oxidoreductase RnfD subunit